jgi:hypothetical protein
MLAKNSADHIADREELGTLPDGIDYAPTCINSSTKQVRRVFELHSQCRSKNDSAYLPQRFRFGCKSNPREVGYRQLQFAAKSYRAFPYASAHKTTGGGSMKTTRSMLCIAAVPFALGACGGGGGGNNGSDTGTLHVAMTDAPSCGFDHVYVTVNKVRVNASSTASDTDGGWTDIALPSPQKIDLLSLTNGVLTDLGRAPLAAGQYQQIRLVLAQNQGNTVANSVVVSGTTAEQPLATPSAAQSGYKIIQPFTVQANTLVDLVLDFNACKSIVQRGNGNYNLKPVVTATPTVVSGSIVGYVTPGEAGAAVYAEQNGQVIRGTVADSNGQFILSPLIQSSSNGKYDVVIVDNRQPNGHANGVVHAVPVTANTTTTIATSAAPITLPSSTVNTIAGTVTASAQATMRALQNDGTGSYELASTNANLDTGAYALAVPAAATMTGTFQGSLPITLSQAAGAAGSYTVEADSASGATQSKGANVSAGSQPGIDFNF